MSFDLITLDVVFVSRITPTLIEIYVIVKFIHEG